MPVTWTSAGEYSDIRYETSGDGIAKITINRPEVRNAFRPQTIVEISQALERAREDSAVGVKKAKEIWFLCRQYDAQQALAMGLVNTVVPLDRLEDETVAWCREMLALSPFALRLVKASFHAHEDGYAGVQQLAHDANLLFYASDEAREGREAYKDKRRPDFSKFPRRP